MSINSLTNHTSTLIDRPLGDNRIVQTSSSSTIAREKASSSSNSTLSSAKIAVFQNSHKLLEYITQFLSLRHHIIARGTSRSFHAIDITTWTSYQKCIRVWFPMREDRASTPQSYNGNLFSSDFTVTKNIDKSLKQLKAANPDPQKPVKYLLDLAVEEATSLPELPLLSHLAIRGWVNMGNRDDIDYSALSQLTSLSFRAFSLFFSRNRQFFSQILPNLYHFEYHPQTRDELSSESYMCPKLETLTFANHGSIPQFSTIIFPWLERAPNLTKLTCNYHQLAETWNQDSYLSDISRLTEGLQKYHRSTLNLTITFHQQYQSNDINDIRKQNERNQKAMCKLQEMQEALKSVKGLTITFTNESNC